MSNLILIAGLPATGNTSFARYLSNQLNIPMVSKDEIKELLYDTIGFKSRAEKITLNTPIMSIESQGITPQQFLDSAKKRGMLDFSKVSYEAITALIKEHLKKPSLKSSKF